MSEKTTYEPREDGTCKHCNRPADWHTRNRVAGKWEECPMAKLPAPEAVFAVAGKPITAHVFGRGS